MFVRKSANRHMTGGMELLTHDKIRTLEENETYKYLGILETDTIKQVEMKDKIRKEYLRRIRKLFQTKHSSRNLIKGIKTWAVPLVRYSRPFLKWTRDELKQMDQRTSPGDLGRLAVTQTPVKNHPLTLMWKTLKE